MSKYIFIGLKKTCLGCFRKKEIRDKDNGTGLKEGGGIEMSNYSAFPYTCMQRSPSLIILTNVHPQGSTQSNKS